MEHYTYQKRLRAIWELAVTLYRDGNRDPDDYFDASTRAELASIGLNPMDVYDYAEDFVSSEEPDYDTFLMICEARRDYFFAEQKGTPSSDVIDSEALPPKDTEVRGIVWLPRIIPKALAKLRGELPADIMYGCGGDRKFFKNNNIHPAEFLRVVWAYQDDEAKTIDWVEARRNATTVETPA
ncbi:MAG: DUF5069 domain-containing protein [Opitutales bacterium]